MSSNGAQLKNQAINAALSQEWSKAIEYNQQLLELYPNDIATLNRLGFAHMRVGDVQTAKSTYQQVLQLDKFNPIAKKSLDRLQQIKSTIPLKQPDTPTKVRTSFIEEPGRTKTVTLVRPGDSQTLLTITIGMGVDLVPRKRRICIETTNREYIGTLPDDIGLRLDKLLKMGYTYDAYIKTIENNTISVFIRELNRSNQAKNIPSFPSNMSSLNHVTDLGQITAIEEIPMDLTPTGEEDPIKDN